MPQPSSILPCSVVIIACNAEAQIAACIESTLPALDVLVVDSGSTDRTCEIARALGARVLNQAFLGFGPQKQFAVNQAVYDWVLCIDSDEVLSSTLRQSITDALEQAISLNANNPNQPPDTVAYQSARANVMMGKVLRHGEGYPDFGMRLFHRKHAHWTADAVHEHVVVNGKTGRLSGDLLHYSALDLNAYIAKQNRYAAIAAERIAGESKKISSAKLISSPSVRFIRNYLFRAGFLDGAPGLVHAAIAAWASFSKYAQAMALQKKSDQKK